jgi:NADPH-dependent 2,4-dienoyl-CoA reductase/sulfur reductase-like enzyme
MTRLLVVGGGAAGMSAASRAKRRDKDMDVTVAEAGNAISFSACGMPYWLGGIVPGGREALIVVSADEARDERGLDVRLVTRVTRLDHASRTAVLEGPDGADEIACDRLILATGAAPRMPFSVEGYDGVFGLRHLDDGEHAKRYVDAKTPAKAVVVGGGFVGLEVAEAFVERGIETTMIHSRATLMSGVVDEEFGQHLNDAVEAAGVTLVTGRRADGVSGTDGSLVVTAGGESFEAGVVVVGVGAMPRNELAEAIGCRLGPAGALTVDASLATGVQDVWACGDSVAVPHRVTRDAVFLPLALHANRMGRIAGANATGGHETFPGVLGTTITRFFDTEVAATGLTQEAAEEAGLDAVAATIKSGSKAAYFPGSQKLSAKIVAEAGSGRVLGAQVVGGRDTAKRIDTMAAAIWMGATCADVEAFDLAYAPPFNPVWDPWAVAARMAGRKA